MKVRKDSGNCESGEIEKTGKTVRTVGTVRTVRTVSVGCPIQILYSYYQIPYRYPFSFKSHNPASAARLTTIKNYVIIYIMKSMPFRAPASHLFLLGKTFYRSSSVCSPNLYNACAVP